jgi:hypothetical protein
MRQLKVTTKPFTNPTLWAIFFLYIIVLCYTIVHHEFWGDEIHSWNIAKASSSFPDLIFNTRYEGHPPVWYTILWIISKFTHDVYYIQVAQFIIAGLVVFLIIFFSSFPVITRILIPFGYFFLFEYGVISRNYAIGALFAFCICLILHKDFKGKILLYYLLLFLLANVHLLTLLLACSLHLYFLLLNIEEKKANRIIILHFISGVLVLLPSLYFIFPPSDSELNTNFWLSHWNIKQLISVLVQPALRAFVPIPAWWKYNFWNTQFLVEAQAEFSLLKIITVLVLFVLFLMIFLILKRNKKGLILFSTNLLLSLIVSGFLSLTDTRYTGFIFIGFILVYWLYCVETSVDKKKNWLVNVLLIIQLIAGIFSVVKDIQLPFSNAFAVKELVSEVPENKTIVTDYWALNALEAFTDKPFYVLEMHKEMSFLKWDRELQKLTQVPYRYRDGIEYLFQNEGIHETYMISIHRPQEMFEMDSLLSKYYRVKLVDKRESAIEKGGNLYLYEISTF